MSEYNYQFRAHHTTDSLGRPRVVEEYIGGGKYERFKRLFLPITDDVDVVVSTKKHGDIPLNELADKDPDYLKWLVSKSKQTKTIKYAVIRILANKPYEVPWDGEEYMESKFFDFVIFKNYAAKLNIQLYETE